MGHLAISENTALFGFMEHGYRFVIVLTLASEAVAVVLLTLFLVLARSRAHGRGATPTQNRPAARPAREPMNQRPGTPAAER